MRMMSSVLVATAMVFLPGLSSAQEAAPTSATDITRAQVQTV
jgi:ABC-type proline/glycine betaine transport system substrate-binding protein